jgi:hypothetical protein
LYQREISVGEYWLVLYLFFKKFNCNECLIW